MMLGFFRILMRHIKAHMIDSMNFHLVINRTCYNVTRGERKTRIIFLHKLLAVGQTQDASVSTHSFGNEVCRMRLFGIKQTRRMELNKLHIFYYTFSTIDHRYTITSSYLGVRRSCINCTCTTRCHQRDSTEICIYLLCIGIKDVCSVTLYIWRATRHAYAQMVLGNNLYCEMVFQYFNIRVSPHSFHESALNLSTRIIRMV